ncbi:MAG TPA: DUF4038 domain-containing protein, partial [Thermomicrobiales bacterium]|nr:DUF4038 domain-containing protein [Thermomicrobiales bacterium]
DQSWLTFYVYQSGHSADEPKIRWLPEGPHANDWRTSPPRPIVNIEPNYEDHPSYPTDVRFTAADVRRASYWSLLVTPTAGVSYGHYSLWAWASGREPVGQAIRRQAEHWLEPWWSVLDTEGARSMTVLRRYFESGAWPRLRPAQDILAAQPGSEDARRFIAAARTEEGDWTLVYTPVGGTIQLNAGAADGASARWFNPRNGRWLPAPDSDERDGGRSFVTPDDGDWVLDLRR